jgi:hypothetical protein
MSWLELRGRGVLEVAARRGEPLPVQVTSCPHGKSALKLNLNPAV